MECKETTNESFTFLSPNASHSQILFTCEHASNRLPPGYSWGSSSYLKDQHWAIDIGSKELTRRLAKHFSSYALFANVSRLVIDYNRPLLGPYSNTLIRQFCDEKQVEFNSHVTEVEKQKRITEFFVPYRTKLEELLSNPQIEWLVSVHSFTDVYEGKKRDVQIGVVYRDECVQSTELAQKIHREFKKFDYDVRLNEPWAGDIMDVLAFTHQLNKKKLCHRNKTGHTPKFGINGKII